IRTGLQLAVLAIRKPSRNGQSDGQMVGSRREERGNVARLRQCITLWNGERQTILEYSKSVHQSHSSVAQRISIKLARGESVAVLPQARSREMHGIFEVPVLCLEMMRGQIHPFRPHDFGKQLHTL